MTDKTTISRGFNKHFFEFIDDILQIFPDNKELKHAKTTFETFKRANPTAIIKSWNMFVYTPYKQHIDAGNIEFFFDKDYSQDLVSLAKSREIMNTIDALREPIRNMSSENKQHSMKYIQNLCKLSTIYCDM